MQPPPGAWEVLYEGQDATIDSPQGGWNSTTGVYTIPYDGFYNVNHTLRVDDAQGLGNRSYSIWAGVQVNGSIGSTYAVTTVPVDTEPGTATIAAVLPLSAGDEVAFVGDIIHQDRVTGVTVFGFAQIIREN